MFKHFNILWIALLLSCSPQQKQLPDDIHLNELVRPVSLELMVIIIGAVQSLKGKMDSIIFFTPDGNQNINSPAGWFTRK